MVLDSTITLPDLRHITDHQEIAGKLNGYIDAEVEYGLVADNVADDKQKILDAMNDMQADGGGKVQLPRGTIRINGALVVPADVHLAGRGRGITTLRSTHAGTAVFMGSTDVLSGSPPSNRSMVSDLSLDGPGPTTAGSIGLEVRKCSRPRVRDVGIADYEFGHYINAGHLDSFCTGGVFENMVVVNCKACLVLGDPAESTADCTDNHFAHCYYNFNGDGTGGEKGVWIRRGNTNHFTDCSAEGADFGYLLGSGVTVAPPGGYSSSRNFFVACRAENIKRAEGLITDGTANQVIGGTVNWDDRANGGTNRFIGISSPVYNRTGLTNTLNGALGGNLTDQVINLTSGVGFPNPSGRGVGIIKIESEYIQYETRGNGDNNAGEPTGNANQLTKVYRGCFGTPVAAHTSGRTVTEIGQGYALRVVQTLNPVEGRPSASDDTRGMMAWQSGANGEGDALWIGAKDEGGTDRWLSPITLVKAGAPGDADFPSVPADGQLALDRTNSRLYIRTGGVWKSVTVA